MATSTNRKHLPLEIRILILDWLTVEHDREALKACRLVDRAFKNAAEAVLFRTVHLSASVRSLQRLESIATTPPLAQHVRQLIFHRGTWEDPDRALGKAAAGKVLNASSQNVPKHSSGLTASCPRYGCIRSFEKTQEFEQNFAELVRDELQFERGEYEWCELLQTLGRNDAFPNLHYAVIAGIDEDGLSGYHLQQTGQHQFRRSYSKFPLHMVLTATRYFSVKQLHAHGVLADLGFVDMLGLEPESFASYFGRLEVLDMDLEKSTPAVHSGIGHVSRTTDLQLGIRNLLAMPFDRLRTLSFGYGTRNVVASPWPTRFEQLGIMRILMGQVFPDLQELSLTHCTIDESILLGFLERHHSTLKTLRISHWAMPTPAPPLGNPATEASFPNCFIRTIWRIPQITNLDHFQLKGSLHSFSMKTGCKFNWNWKVGPGLAEHEKGVDTLPVESPSSAGDVAGGVTPSSQPNMLTSIEDYLCHRGPFPFSDALLRVLDDNDKGLSELPPTFDDEGSECSFDCHRLVTERQDPSWQFVIDEWPEYLPRPRW